jgi:hypothetical protein
MYAQNGFNLVHPHVKYCLLPTRKWNPMSPIAWRISLVDWLFLCFSRDPFSLWWILYWIVQNVSRAEFLLYFLSYMLTLFFCINNNNKILTWSALPFGLVWWWMKHMQHFFVKVLLRYFIFICQFCYPFLYVFSIFYSSFGILKMEFLYDVKKHPTNSTTKVQHRCKNHP